MKGNFGQAECAHYLQRVESGHDCMGVLSAYVYAKYMHGNSTHQVLNKLRLLVIYLRVSGFGAVLERFPNAFLVIQYHVSQLGGGAIGACATEGSVEREAWNHVRRVCYKPAKGAPGGADDPRVWGAKGPGPVIGIKGIERRHSGGVGGGTAAEQVRVTALRADEVAMLGPHRAPASYHTLTLPAYEDEGDLTT